MGFFFKKANKANRCLLCGSEVAAGKCTACGREAKPLVPLSALNWQKVPLSVGEALGEQKKKLFGNALLTVKEMIANGELYIADIHIDGVYEHEYDRTPMKMIAAPSMTITSSSLPRTLPPVTQIARSRRATTTEPKRC